MMLEKMLNGYDKRLRPDFGGNFQFLYYYIINFCNLIGLEQSVVFQFNLKYLQVKITNLMWVVV